MPFAENLDLFISPLTPGYRVLMVDYENVPGIFDNDYVEEGFTESSVPVFWVKSADVPCIEQGDPVVDEAADTAYEVANIQPDGTGITMIRLRKL